MSSLQPKLGCPYTPLVYLPEGSLGRICPVCGEVCTEEADRHGELITNNYGAHCVKEHPNA